MEQFLNFIDVLIVWMSFYLSIYYVKKDNYKKIKYRIAKKDDKYLVVIWNASLTTIYKEDLYFEMNPVIWTPNNGGSFLLWQNLQENKK